MGDEKKTPLVPMSEPDTKKAPVAPKMPEIKGVAKAKPTKTPMWKRMLGVIISDEVHDIKEFMFLDVLAPAIKSTLHNVGLGALDLVLYGRRGAAYSSKDRRGAVGAHIPYSSMSSRAYNSLEGDRAALSDRERRRQEEGFDIKHLESIEFEFEDDARDVVAYLLDLINEYGHAKVSDFLAAAQLPSNSIHPKWGWYDLSGWKIAPLPSGRFCIVLPKPIYLR